jgi:3-oxoacyl-[acyl-carrier protein] reductase
VCSSDLGRAIAHCCAGYGARLLLHARDKDNLTALYDELPPANETVCLGGDLAESGCAKQIILDARQQGGVDVLINCAGQFKAGPFAMLGQAELTQLFQVNLFSLIELIQYASRLMQQKGSGSIVNIASIMGVRGEAGQAAYEASKAAVIGLTLSLAKEFAPSGIRVNAVAPGLIDTDMAHTASAGQLQRRIGQISLGRMGTPEEVAEAVAFLASDRASYISGQILGIDGAMRL